MTNRKIDPSIIALAVAIAAAVLVAVSYVSGWLNRKRPFEEPGVESTSGIVPGKSSPTKDFNVPSARKSVVFIKCLVPGLSPGFGSGFLVSNDGLIYTNRHVVKPDQPIKGTVVLVGVPSAADPDELDFFKAEVVHATQPGDPLDFAILKVKARDSYGPFPALPLTSEVPELASSVAVIGYPYITKDQRVLAFNKGSISATRVILDKRAYYQTDAAFNPGNSGGPLLNLRGEAIGIVTKRKANSAGMGYALQLKEVQIAALGAKYRSAGLAPQPGPLDPHNLPTVPSIPPVPSAWDIVHGKAQADKDILSVHNNGGPYWIATKDDLPENFQIVMNCQVEFLRDRQQTSAHDDVRRTLCIRFGMEDIGKDIMAFVGTRLQFRDQDSLFWQEKDQINNGPQGCPDDPFVLTISRQRGVLTVAVDEKVVFQLTATPGVKSPTKLSIGGILSKLNLGEVSIIEIEPGSGKHRRIYHKYAPPIRGNYGPPIVIPPNSPPPLISVDVAEFAGDLVERPIQSKIADVAVGGGGRYLVLHLPEARELAVFDVSLAKVVHSIKLKEADAKIAIGLDKVIVALPGSKKIERWNLLTGVWEQTATLKIKGPLALAVMGSASRGPVLIGAGAGINSELMFLDVHKLKPLDFKRTGPGPIQIDKNLHVRASADGTVFAASGPGEPPHGITTLVLSGNEARSYFTKEGAGHAVPGPDGHTIHSFLGLFDQSLKPLNKLGRDLCTLPAEHGEFALRFNLLDGARDERVTLHLIGDDRPIAPGPQDLLAGVELNDRGPFPADKRIHFIPNAKVIVTIPNSNDKLVLHRFDPEDALDKSALDYLYVTSLPPIWGRKGSPYRYQMTVSSRKGDVKFRVVAGPPGLEVSKKGLITWSVPSLYAENESDVVIAVSDETRQEVHHAFKIALRGERPKAAGE